MINFKTMRPTALAVAVAVGLSGCASVDNAVSDNNSGVVCGAGALAGALLIGGITAAAGGNSKQIATGAAAGGALGCGIAYAYKQRVDRLRAVAKQQGLDAQVNEIQRVNAEGKTETVGVEALVQVQEMFPSGSSTLTPEGYTKLSAMAKEFANSREKSTQGAQSKKVLVVGHSDSTGSAALNQSLSEARARSVGEILATAGIPKQDIFFQGAGSSRPVADNTTVEGRTKNRRVEFVEVDNQDVLVQRVRSERNNSKYLAHGTAVEQKAKPAAAKTASSSKPTSSSQPTEVGKAPTLPSSPKAPVIVQLDSKGGIDFGGSPVTDTRSTLASHITPKSSSFSLIGTAYADQPVVSCVGDLPRVDGEVKNLATGATLKDFATTDFYPGLNGQVWAQKVNGHVASVGPIGILRDSAQVPVAPKMQFISDFANAAQKKQSQPFQSIANTYEGETEVLYRVFAVDQKNAPVSCMDIVFDKRAGTATAGEIYYAKQGDAYVAPFQPIRR